MTKTTPHDTIPRLICIAEVGEILGLTSPRSGSISGAGASAQFDWAGALHAFPTTKFAASWLKVSRMRPLDPWPTKQRARRRRPAGLAIVTAWRLSLPEIIQPKQTCKPRHRADRRSNADGRRCGSIATPARGATTRAALRAPTSLAPRIHRGHTMSARQSRAPSSRWREIQRRSELRRLMPRSAVNSSGGYWHSFGFFSANALALHRPGRFQMPGKLRWDTWPEVTLDAALGGNNSLARQAFNHDSASRAPPIRLAN